MGFRLSCRKSSKTILSLEKSRLGVAAHADVRRCEDPLPSRNIQVWIAVLTRATTWRVTWCLSFTLKVEIQGVPGCSGGGERKGCYEEIEP
jgi:hypothetical protein